MKPPIDLALVWHFHQPDYADPATGAPTMPWTRLHALKDYADMAAHLERHPGVRATFNVVPTLLDQLSDLASGTTPPDPFLRLAMKPAADLGLEERAFVVGHFFSLNRDVMAVGLRRFHELEVLRGAAPAAAIGPLEVARFDVAALRDLQVLFHVAWSGTLLQADPLVARLRARGRGFSEEDKAELFARQREFLAGVLPRWRRLYDSGQIELSVTPYYHPILPLICDLASAREAIPDLPLPHVRFMHPEDADLHLAKGQEAFEAVFGRRAEGGWPSEGAISELALARMAAAGYRWAASDEDVLFASLGEALPTERTAYEARRAELLYRPWRLHDGPALLFRDHDLSDRIGFSYAGRAPDDAARDFIGRLLQIRAAVPDDGRSYVVSVILDGENAWEHYDDNAAPFFDALYGALEREPGIRTRTASEAADPASAAPLGRVVAGSWIYRNLATWAGHPEKNRAWELLAAARHAVREARGEPAWDDPAWRAILAAEGSDWFWWYGDDHPTAYGAEFDASFRNKLRGAYVAAGLAAPGTLDEPVRKARAATHSLPSGPVHATLDGRVTDYFEWRRAGRVRIVHGAMHAAVRYAHEMLFGSDGSRLFVRLDPAAPGSLAGLSVAVRTPAGPAGGSTQTLDRVLEIAVPLQALGPPGERVRFAVELRAADGASQRIPADGFIDLPPPEADPSRFDWSV
jgi:alpha-amylase/alpha-mannosidase (GH57 family)